MGSTQLLDESLRAGQEHLNKPQKMANDVFREAGFTSLEYEKIRSRQFILECNAQVFSTDPARDLRSGPALGLYADRILPRALYHQSPCTAGRIRSVAPTCHG
jgi:hypothetical protein